MEKRLNFLQILSQTFCYLELSFIPLFPLSYSILKNKKSKSMSELPKSPLLQKRKEVAKKEKKRWRQEAQVKSLFK